MTYKSDAAGPFISLRRLVAVALIALVAIFTGGGCTKEAKKSRHLARAEGYFAAGDYNKAEVEYLNVLRLDVTSTNAISHLGKIYFEDGDVKRAYMFLNREKELAPKELESRVRLGLVYLSVNMSKEARQEANFVLTNAPGHEEAIFLLVDTIRSAKEVEEVQKRVAELQKMVGRKAPFIAAEGRFALLKGDFKAAEASFKEAVAADPKSAGAYSGLADTYALQQNYKDADQALTAAVNLSPIRSGRRLRQAELKLKMGLPEEAQKILKEVCDKAPDYLPAWQLRAQIAFNDRKLDEANGFLTRILARDMNHYEAGLLTARIKLVQGQAAEAVKDFGRLATAYPKVPQVQYEMALAHFGNKDMAKTITCLSQALALEPAYVDAAVMLAELNIRKGNPAEAVTLLVQLIKLRPNAVPAYFVLAEAYRARGALDEALDVYRRLAGEKMIPKNPRVHFLMGTTLREQKKPVEARKAFERALELEPDDMRTIDQLVEMDVLDKQYATALQRLEKTMVKYPKASAPRVTQARVYMAQAQFDKAEPTLLKAIEADPDARAAYMLLSQMYVAAKKHAQALEKLGAIVAKNPKDASAIMQIGMIQDSLKDYKAAKESYEKVLALNPRSGAALNNLAFILSEYLGEPDKALEYARRAREAAPEDPFVADTLGWILFKRKDYAAALPAVQDAAAKLSNAPDILFHLGMAHYMMGDEAPALTALQRAVQAKDPFVGKEEAERRLALLKTDMFVADPAALATMAAKLGELPDDPVAMMRLASIQERLGAPDKAREAYEKVLKVNPKSLSATLKFAQLCVGPLKDNQRALELAKAARVLEPEDPGVAHSVGRLAYRAGDLKYALTMLQESSRAKANDPEVLYDLALTHYALGQVVEAESDLKAAQQTGTAFAAAEAAKQLLFLIGLSGNPVLAEQSAARVQEVLKADPTSVPALMAAATIYEKRADQASARQAYDKILAANPGFKPATRQMALLLAAATGEEAKAQDWLAKAHDAFPQDADITKAQGIVAYRRNDFPRATQFLKDSARKRGSDAELFYYLGMAHNQLKEKQETVTALKKAIALNLNKPLADEAKRVLDTLK